MHPIRLASAGWVLAAAPSKVPFYVAGGLLAAWAVVLALIGISHHDFPGSAGRARLVMLTSFTLVAATVAMAVVTAGEEGEETAAAPAPAPAASALALTADPGGQLRYDKSRVTVAAGRVPIRLTSRSAIPHNVTVARGSEVIVATKTITGGETSTAARLQPGDYVFFCSVDGHRAAGMEGTLTVR